MQISDCGTTDDGLAYLVMELLEGDSLSKRLEQSGGLLPVPEAMRLGRQVAGALTAAHKKGIIHRGLMRLTFTVEKRLFQHRIRKGSERAESGKP